MSDSVLAQHYHLRGYTVFELDALRKAVYDHVLTGSYFPSERAIQYALIGHYYMSERDIQDAKRAYKSPSAEGIAIVEERVRTFMIAGIIAPDLPKGYAQGFVVSRKAAGHILYWDECAQQWRTDLVPACMVASEQFGRNTIEHVLRQDMEAYQAAHPDDPSASKEQLTHMGLHHATCAEGVVTLGKPITGFWEPYA